MLFIKTHKGELLYILSNLATSIVAMLSSFIAASFIEPSDLGVIQSILLVSTYTTFLNFGIFSGLNRNLSYYKSKGNIEKMQKEIDTSYTVSWIVAIMGLLLGLFTFVFFIYEGRSNIYFWSAILLIITLFFNPITLHVDCTFRSSQEFENFGRLKIIQCIIYAIFSFLPALCGYLGRIIANSINILSGYALRLKYIPYKNKGYGDIESLKDLFTSGFPIMLNGYILTVFEASDKTYIAANFTSNDMGYYTIAGYCTMIMAIIPTALNTMLYPKATAVYGSNGNRISLLPLWKKSIILYMLVLTPMIAIAYFVMPPIVELIMPNYIKGIDTGKIALINSFTFIYSGPSVIFGTLKKNKIYIIAVSVSLLSFWVIVSAFKDCFQTIESIAVLQGVVSFLLMSFVISYSYYLIKH